MERRKCPNCSVVNWHNSKECVRCKAKFVSPSIDISNETFGHNNHPSGKSESFSAGKVPLSRDNRELPNKTVSPLIIVGVLAFFAAAMFAVYKIVQFKPKTNSPIIAANAQQQPAVGNGRIRYEHDQDAVFWQVRDPDLATLISEFRPKAEGHLGGIVMISAGGSQLSSRGHTSIDGYTGRPTAHSYPDTYTKVEPTYGNCGGKIENMVATDYWFLKEGENVTMSVQFEGDFFAKYPTSKKSCGELRAEGRKSIQNSYVWYRGRWMELNEAKADTNFKDSALKPDTLAIGMEENRKFEESLRKEQTERDERHARYKAARANRNAAP